jgi:hypothetical protein
MSNAVLLGSENETLRIENQRQKRKRTKKRTVLSGGEGASRAQAAQNVLAEEQQRQRASDRSVHHKSAVCALQQNTLHGALDGRQLVSR